MNGLNNRLKRLEGLKVKSDQAPFVFVGFVSTGDEPENMGQAITPAGTFNRQKDEDEGPFLLRVFAANAPDGDPTDLSDDDLELFLAGLDEDIAVARASGRPVTDEMLELAMSTKEILP